MFFIYLKIGTAPYRHSKMPSILMIENFGLLGVFFLV